MVWLDCHDVDSALVSLARVIGASRAKLEQTIADYDEERWDGSEAPEVRTPREVLEQLGKDVETAVERLAGAYWTRSPQTARLADSPSSYLLGRPGARRR